jgi:hypothetical protein
MAVKMPSWRLPWGAAAALRGPAGAALTPPAAKKPKRPWRARARRSASPVAMLMILTVPATAEPESPEGWTCARWTEAREHHRSKTIEIWLKGYLTSSNQWALALGWADAPLLVPEVLNLLDQNCRSSPTASVTDILDVIQSEFLRANWRDTK